MPLRTEKKGGGGGGGEVKGIGSMLEDHEGRGGGGH